MNIKIKNRALSHVGNGFKPFLQALQTCGGIGYCRDCSPNSPERKAARSGTAPYSLGAAERFETAPYSLGASERLQTVPYFSFCHEP